MKIRGSMMGYLVTFLLALFVIIFVSITPAPGGGSQYEISADGWKTFRKGMDVAGGVRLTYKIDLSKYRTTYTNPQEYLEIVNNVKTIILKNIDNRISQLGVSDYESYLQQIGDEEFLVVEIGGVADLEEAKTIIGRTVELEFKVAYEGDGSDVRESRQLFSEDLLKQIVVAPESMQILGFTNQDDNVFYGRYDDVALEDLPEIYRQTPDFFAPRPLGEVYPTLIEGVHSVIPPMTGMTTTETTIRGWTIARLIATGSKVVDESTQETVDTYTIEEVLVRDIPAWIVAQDPATNDILNGAYFRFASVSQSQLGQPVATITFDERGSTIFCNLTEQIIGKQMAIFVGGQLITAPVIREKICGGSAQIDGDFTPASAQQLVQGLNEGALPAALILSNEEKVSAKLGDSALQGALMAALIGLVLVFVYLVSIYGLRYGLVGGVTLVFFLTVLFAFVKLIGYAISLSGLAAILLSIGMGVDANILIYERIKEELKGGARSRDAIIQGYERSRQAIRDGNVTTLIIGVLLLFVGTNIFKGFGTMIIVTILFTLFVMVPFVKEFLLLLDEMEQKK